MVPLGGTKEVDCVVIYDVLHLGFLAATQDLMPGRFKNFKKGLAIIEVLNSVDGSGDPYGRWLQISVLLDHRLKDLPESEVGLLLYILWLALALARLLCHVARL